MKIYENIKKLREQAGLSQSRLAEMVGYKDRSSIAKVEAGEVDLSQSKIAAFAEALNVSPASLMGWEDPLIDDFDNTLDEVVSVLENADCIVLYTDSWRDNTVVVKDKKGEILLSCQDSDLVSRTQYLRKKHLPLTAKNVLDLAKPEEETIHTIAAHAVGKLSEEDAEKILKFAEYLLSEEDK